MLPDELAAVAADQDEKEALAGATLASGTAAATAATSEAAAEAAPGRRHKHGKKHKKPCEAGTVLQMWRGAWAEAEHAATGAVLVGLCCWDRMQSWTQWARKARMAPLLVAGLNRKIEAMIKPYTSKYAGAPCAACTA